MLRPNAVDDAGFTIEQDADGAFVVRGAKPERWVAQTNFDNEEAVGYLADRLARLGVEDALAKAGAEPGCLVRIGVREFDWQPTVYAGARVHARVSEAPTTGWRKARPGRRCAAPGRPQGPPPTHTRRAGRAGGHRG